MAAILSRPECVNPDKLYCAPSSLCALRENAPTAHLGPFVIWTRSCLNMNNFYHDVTTILGWYVPAVPIASHPKVEAMYIQCVDTEGVVSYVPVHQLWHTCYSRLQYIQI